MHLADLLNGTRGQVVGLIRGGTATIAEIAAALGVTVNNVRAHLATLERDGIVERAGKRGGIRKPTNVYRLSSAAEALYARAYEPVMIEFVEELCETGTDPAPTFRGVGRRLAAAVGDMSGWTTERKMEAIAEHLRTLGATPVIEVTDDAIVLHSRQCPLSSLVNKCPQACEIGRTMISTATGLQVIEQCDHGQRASCGFRVVLAKKDPGDAPRS